MATTTIQRLYQGTTIYAYAIGTDDPYKVSLAILGDARDPNRGWDSVRALDASGRTVREMACPISQTFKRSLQGILKKMNRAA